MQTIRARKLEKTEDGTSVAVAVQSENRLDLLGLSGQTIMCTVGMSPFGPFRVLSVGFYGGLGDGSPSSEIGFVLAPV